MPLRRPSVLTLLTIALLVLLPTLAALQYRWVGQVNDAERERMQRNLRTAAVQFREAFDGEIARAVFGLRIDANTVRERAWQRYADRYDSWSETAAYPAIVSDIYLVDGDGTALEIRRWNPVARSFDDVEWPIALEPWRDYFKLALADFVAGQPPQDRPRPPEDDSLLIAPLINVFPRPLPTERTMPAPLFGFTIVQLDLDEIRTQVLPALAERHFINGEGDKYRVAVMAGRPPARVVYQSDPSTPVDPAHADASEPLHGAFQDQPRRNGLLEFIGGRRGGAVRARVLNRDTALWTLVVQHQSGSLDAAVASVRRRNLAISFGTLLLLTISVGLLAHSSRREQRLARQQIEFVAGVSHELRTPVAVIRSAAENLAQGVVSSGDRVKRYGEVIEGEARRLGEMLERVLQYAGITSGAGVAARGRLSAADVVNDAIDSAGAVIGAAQVQRQIAADLPAIVGDAAALRSAVQNLLVNAVKYGGDSGWVGITAERRENGRRPEVQISVEDHGPGIPPSELQRIFEPFFRGADAIARQVQGNGLGLSLVERIVTSHGGRVTVTSAPGRTRFTIALPAAEATA